MSERVSKEVADVLHSLDGPVHRALREGAHSDDCAVFTDEPGTPFRCTCWKHELRVAMAKAYGLKDEEIQ